MEYNNIFENIDSCDKSYIIGYIGNNITNIEYNENKVIKLQIYISPTNHHITTYFEPKYCTLNDKNENIYSIESIDMINHILNNLFEDISQDSQLSLSYFTCPENCKYSFLRAYFEKHFNFSKSDNTITVNFDSDENLEFFTTIMNIPYTKNNKSILYIGTNYIDLFGKLYQDDVPKDNRISEIFKDIESMEIVLGYKKLTDDAYIPAKTNYSDVGLDLTAIGISKRINDETFLCKTGISLEIPVGYYVEIVPRSSISKTGYMLSNSIGIIDCSYKGELLIALTKSNKDIGEPEFPLRCCQLIMKKQIFPKMKEISLLTESTRGSGGFGSTG